VLISRNNRLLFAERGLPALSSGRVYQLWLIRSKREPVVSGGIFETNTDGAQLEVSDASLLAKLTAVAVTDEPAGGSRLPTGRKVLIATTKG
jgi:anti-sigma-K factor RskA